MVQHEPPPSFHSPSPGAPSQAGAAAIAAGCESSPLSSRRCHLLSSDLVSFSSCSTSPLPAARCSSLLQSDLQDRAARSRVSKELLVLPGQHSRGMCCHQDDALIPSVSFFPLCCYLNYLLGAPPQPLPFLATLRITHYSKSRCCSAHLHVLTPTSPLFISDRAFLLFIPYSLL